jgi:hypothetical protein
VTNKPVAATDVVIIQTEIWEVQDIVDAAGAFSNDMRMTGTGPATVFRDGLRQDGTWSAQGRPLHRSCSGTPPAIRSSCRPASRGSTSSRWT